MNSTKVAPKIQRTLEQLLENHPRIKQVVHAIAEHGGQALLVGGVVRDLFLDQPIKDIDIEVYGLNVDTLEQLLTQYGHVRLVGKSFGVFRIDSLDVDWSLPRSDSAGRKPDVVVDPYMSYEDAFLRRDLTMNAMGIDLRSFALIDPFNGLQDLKNNILRTPSVEKFVEDPLRFYRVMQFISRFDMAPDEQLNRICQEMDISSVSVERIETEFEKMLLRSKRPSLGIRWLHNIGCLAEILPELAATVGCPQEPEYHPEGDVFEHSMQSLDAAARLVRHSLNAEGFDFDSDHDTLTLLYAALCHDIGKPETTEKREGKIISYGHAMAGAQLVPQMLKRITTKKELIDNVAQLVRYHLMPLEFIEGKAKAPAYKRLARKVAPFSLAYLAQLALADKQGRNPKSHIPLKIKDKTISIFLERAQDAQVKEKKEVPVLQGRDIIDEIEPGPRMGELLDRAYEIQIEEGITDKQEVKRRILKNK